MWEKVNKEKTDSIKVDRREFGNWFSNGWFFNWFSGVLMTSQMLWQKINKTKEDWTKVDKGE